MKTLTYKIQFNSFWHTGSGLSSGTESDLVVIKDKNGLPFIPGKTLKGLLREAANIINQFDSKLVTKEFINTVFGEVTDEDKNTVSKEAQVFFSDAYLSENMREHFNANPQHKDLLFKNISSTKINKEGQAEDHSLRQMEVAIPLDLYAELIDMPNEYVTQMEYCFSWVKKLGLNRSRGLGRCEISKI